MPLFLSDEEFELCHYDPVQVAERADQYIRDLHRQLETVRAEADAASIAAEHTCSLLEQRYAAVSADYARLLAENARLSASFEQRLSELAETQAEKHNLHLKAIAKDGEIERLTVEASELHKSKRQLLELVEQKDLEIGEKNATIQSYLDKIIHLTDHAASKEAKLYDNEAELARCHAECTRRSQEKELIAKHNEWLNEELTVKVNSLIELRRTHMDYEADMSAKLADVESQLNESSKTLKRSEGRVRELESKLKSLEEELCSCKDAAAASEEHFATELATVTKLAELHKESSEEWSRKAGELEGVIKALETHLSQVENAYKEKLEKELSSRREFEKAAADFKDKLDKCELELEKARKDNELSLLPLSSFQSDATMEKWVGGDNEQTERLMIVPKIPAGVSGTALAASLLRNGWSLAKMYEKYQEAADALRHERWERKHSEAILERVLHEIEEKAELILDERAQHEKMTEAYYLMNQKLQQALSVHDTYENTIRTLKAELKRSERDHNVAQKEIADLQKEVTVLLKECRDVQLRCGVAGPMYPDDLPASVSLENHGSAMEKSIPDHLLTFKDIHELVEQNAQLRSLVHRLSDEEESRESELRNNFQLELQKVADEAAAKVEAVLRRSQEQGQMIESLHSSVAMYKKLYDEERRSHSLIPRTTEPIIAIEGGNDLMHLFEDSQEVAKKAREQLVERIRTLEEELAKTRNDLTSIRLERDKMVLEAKFAREKLDSFMKEFEHQRDQVNGVSARNVELTQLLVDYQRKLREASDSLLASEERSRKLSMEVSVWEREREILVNSEKKASEEVRSLSERVHRLQSTLDVIQSANEVREDARRMDKVKTEEHAKHIEREWAEAKKELHEERDRVRKLTAEREKILENSLAQIEETRKQLADAWRAVSSAESRAAAAEARCSDLEAKIKVYEKVRQESGVDHSMSSDNDVLSDLLKMKEERDKLKEEAQANKEYMLQYKEIAHMNEVALKNMESAHDEFKAESEKLKKSLEDEVVSLREKVFQLEKDYMLKSNEALSAVHAKEEALGSAISEIECLKKEISLKMIQISEMEAQIAALKKTVDEEHQHWRDAQNNYERQVILQSETIQEMTRTSQALSLLQVELSELQKLSDMQKAENEQIKASWEAEKNMLQRSKNEAENKCYEIDEQNKILHNRLEAMHIKLANMEHCSSGTGFRGGAPDSQESDLQHVINYLRRSKEIAETEISLLKQEKLRLQSQLDSALKASEAAQVLLHSERENARAAMFTEVEFKSLQLQVREINLLRESNSQLREENKYNFEECQKFREAAQKAKLVAEQLGDLLRNKESEVEACQKEIEIWKMEKAHLESEITELHENSERINLVDYDQMKDEFQQAQVKLKERESEIESTKNVVYEKQENISHLQQELLKCKLEIDEREKKMSDILQIEETRRLEVEKQKKLTSHFKKRLETITKEREELSKDNQSLQKQLEDFKSVGKRTVGEGTSEQAMKEKEKEKDTRMQILEKTLEREREDLRREREDNRKEKQKRQKIESLIVNTVKHLNQEKKKLEEQIKKHKQVESSGAGVSQPPPHNSLDEQAAAYFQAYDHFELTANSARSEIAGISPIPSNNEPLDVSGDASAATAVHQVASQPRQTSQPGKASEQRERRFTAPKPSVDARKRKLVRPSLEQSEEPAADVEMLEVEGLPAVERGKQGESHEQEMEDSISLSAPSSSRKRVASSSISEFKDEFFAQSEDNSVAAPIKKLKGSEALETAAAPEDIPLEILNMPPMECSDIAGAVEAHPLENELIDNADVQDYNVIKEREQSEEPSAGMSRDVDSKNEDDAFMGTYSVKLKETTPDEFPINEGQDVQQSAVDAEDEKEEGELVPDTPEQPTEGIESEETQPESILAEVAEVGGGTSEIGDWFEIGTPDVLIEDKNEKNDNVEEVGDGSDKSGDHVNDNDFEQSPLTTLGSPECSPNIHVESTSETVSSNAVSGVEEGVQQGTKSRTEGVDLPSIKSGTEELEQQAVKSGGTTITLAERAKERALMRQAGIGVPRSPPRGRGRGSGSFRRDSGRGARGARSGRGQSSSE